MYRLILPVKLTNSNRFPNDLLADSGEKVRTYDDIDKPTCLPDYFEPTAER